jgi:hypothetical protein
MSKGLAKEVQSFDDVAEFTAVDAECTIDEYDEVTSGARVAPDKTVFKPSRRGRGIRLYACRWSR